MWNVRFFPVLSIAQKSAKNTYERSERKKFLLCSNLLIVQWQQLTGFLVIRRHNSQCVLVWWKTQNRQPPRTIMLQTDHHSSITTKRIFAFLRHAETIGTNNWNFSTAFWGNGLYTIKNKQTTPPNKQSNKCGSCSACLWHTRKKNLPHFEICPIYMLSLNY